MPAHALALQILHEFMHMKLWMLQELVELHRGAGRAVHFAPWRADPRTVPALLQGAYAHVGVTDFWRVRRLGTEGSRRREAELEFVLWLEQTRIALAGLLASGELTADGIRFVRGLEKTLTDWAGGEPIPAESRRVATDLVTVAAVRWRLRNTGPAPGQLAALLELYASGRSCPGRLERPRMSRPAEPEGWRPSTLELLIRSGYTGLPVETDDPAHRAFHHRDYERASALYRRMAENQPERDDGWSGLALALARAGETHAAEALTGRPDLVRAMAHATGDNPLAVARWLGTSRAEVGPPTC
jgi:hypothetical protein